MTFDREGIAAVCAAGGLIVGKLVDLLIQRARSQREDNESEASRFAKETRQFRHELIAQINTLRKDLNEAEEEARKIDRENHQLLWDLSAEKMSKQALEAELRRLRDEQNR